MFTLYSRFSSKDPGICFVKKHLNEEEVRMNLLRVPVTEIPGNLPPRLLPPGLSKKRREYLYNNIRPYCREDTKDLICPGTDDSLANED